MLPTVKRKPTTCYGNGASVNSYRSQLLARPFGQTPQKAVEESMTRHTKRSTHCNVSQFRRALRLSLHWVIPLGSRYRLCWVGGLLISDAVVTLVLVLSSTRDSRAATYEYGRSGRVDVTICSGRHDTTRVMLCSSHVVGAVYVPQARICPLGGQATSVFLLFRVGV